MFGNNKKCKEIVCRKLQSCHSVCLHIKIQLSCSTLKLQDAVTVENFMTLQKQSHFERQRVVMALWEGLIGHSAGLTVFPTKKLARHTSVASHSTNSKCSED